MLTIGVKPKNSSDLDVGRRPELKSDEFFVLNPNTIEIISFFVRDRRNKCCSYWQRDPADFLL